MKTAKSNSATALKVKTSLKAGSGIIGQAPQKNHNETQVRAAVRSADWQSAVSRIGNPRPSRLAIGATTLKVKTSLKAGAGIIPEGPVKH